jgi:hypothetical protein
MVYAFNPKNW